MVSEEGKPDTEAIELLTAFSPAEREKRRAEREKSLRTCSKELYELVSSEKFTVLEVLGESEQTSFTSGDGFVGSMHHSYHGGFVSRLTLKVTPDNKDIPVRTLVFEGVSPVKIGDYIKAEIPLYERKTVPSGQLAPIGCHGGAELVFYSARGYSADEYAIELTLLSPDGTMPLRIDRAACYKDFVKKE